MSYHVELPEAPMRAGNNKLTIFLIALIAAVTVGVALRQQLVTLQTPPETPPVETPAPTATPIPVSDMRGKVLISEIMDKNRSVAADEDGDFPDWFELWNTTDRVLYLNGWRIADRQGRIGWAIPPLRILGGDHVVIYASRKDRAGEELHTDFALSEEDCLCLYDADGALVDTAACAACEDDVALMLTEDGGWAATLYPTPGFANTTAGYILYQKTLRPAGPLVISEAAVRNIGRYHAGGGVYPDWVEIKNISDAPVLLSDYYLSDRVGERQRWRMPAQTLAPGKCVVFACDDNPEGLFPSTPCTGFALNSEHEQLYLSDSEGTLIDCATLRDIPYDASYGRMDGQAGFFYFAVPSPGRDNADGMRSVSPTPVSLTADGVFEGTERVTVELRGEGTLRYTLDCSVPTEKSSPVDGPIEIGKTSVLRVRSFCDGALPSRPLTLSFVMNEGHSLPVVSLVADDPKSFSNLYNAGAKGFEMPGALSFFREGERGFTVPCGISMNGETSLILPKKNLALHFRGAYGQASLEYDVFGTGPTSFKALLLRAGQDQNDAVFRNELAQRLADKAGCDVINQRSLFCALYINGTYSGLYTLKDKPNAALYASLAGVDRKSVRIYEAPAPYRSDFYQEIVDFSYHADMSLDENYERLGKLMDLDSLIDWLFLEGFSANTDITSGNLRYVRSDEADGRWRLMFYDLDCSFRSFDSIQKNVLDGYGAAHIQVAGIAVPLKKNAQFRDRFLTRAADYLAGPMSNESILEEIDAMAELIRPELERDYARFHKNLNGWDRSVDMLRSMVRDRNWRQANIDRLCVVFDLTKDERAHYFGEIDGK